MAVVKRPRICPCLRPDSPSLPLSLHSFPSTMSDSILDVEMRRVRRNAERTLNLRRRTRQFESLDARDLEKLDRRILMVRPPPHLAVHQEDDRSLRRRTADSIILFKCKGDRDKAR